MRETQIIFVAAAIARCHGIIVPATVHNNTNEFVRLEPRTVASRSEIVIVATRPPPPPPRTITDGVFTVPHISDVGTIEFIKIELISPV